MKQQITNIVRHTLAKKINAKFFDLIYVRRRATIKSSRVLATQLMFWNAFKLQAIPLTLHTSGRPHTLAVDNRGELQDNGRLMSTHSLQMLLQYSCLRIVLKYPDIITTN